MKELHLALIGGPQYDGLLELLPKFQEQTGYRLHFDSYEVFSLAGRTLAVFG
jgi:hypothetical protein